MHPLPNLDSTIQTIFRLLKGLGDEKFTRVCGGLWLPEYPSIRAGSAAGARRD